MYGFWILTIIAGALAVIGFSIFLLGRKKDKDDTILGGLIIMTLFGGLSIFFLAWSIGTPISVKREYKIFENKREIVEQAYLSGTALDNISITATIIEANTWLAEVKADKEMFGIWSNYYYLDLENIDPIALPTK